jgi:hypothetical protein
MINFFPEKTHLDGTSRLHKPRNQDKIFKVSSSQTKEFGSSIIELLLATTLALVAVNASAKLINIHNTNDSHRTAAATNVIKVAISNDLAWLRQYAVLWRMQKGPFSDLKTGSTDRVTNLTSTIYAQRTSPSNEYEPPPECSSTQITAMADQFQDDAANLYTHLPSNDQPPNPINDPPNTVPTDETEITINLPNSASVYSLTRTIKPDIYLRGALIITYTLTQSSTEIFNSSLYLPAAGWCPT